MSTLSPAQTSPEKNKDGLAAHPTPVASAQQPEPGASAATPANGAKGNMKRKSTTKRFLSA